MSNVRQITRNTATSTRAIAKRAGDLVERYLPAIIGRVVEIDHASSLQIRISVRPAGRTDATRDPEVIISAKPDYGEEVIRLKARLTGEADDAQLSLIQEIIEGEVDYEDDETGETGAAAATG